MLRHAVPGVLEALQVRRSDDGGRRRGLKAAGVSDPGADVACLSYEPVTHIKRFEGTKTLVMDFGMTSENTSTRCQPSR